MTDFERKKEKEKQEAREDKKENVTTPVPVECFIETTIKFSDKSVFNCLLWLFFFRV